MEENRLIQKINNYYDDKSRLSASFLKAVLKGPSDISKYFSRNRRNNMKTDEYFRKGSIVDCYITTPSLFNLEYFVNQGVDCSDSIKKMVEHLVDTREEKYIAEIPEEILFDCVTQFDYNRKWLRETRVNKLIEKGASYYYQLMRVNGRTITTVEEEAECKKVQMQIELHNHTVQFTELANNPNIKVINQKIIKWVEPITEELCKSMLDRVLINDTDFHIGIMPPHSLLIIDYKTTSYRSETLATAYKKNRYDLSMSFYYNAVKESIKNNSKLKHLTVLNPILIFGSFSCSYSAWYQLDDRELELGKFGGVYNDEGKIESAEGKPTKAKAHLGYIDAIGIWNTYQQLGSHAIEYQIATNNGQVKKVRR